jgi:hypothetical protein
MRAGCRCSNEPFCCLHGPGQRKSEKEDPGTEFRNSSHFCEGVLTNSRAAIFAPRGWVFRPSALKDAAGRGALRMVRPALIICVVTRTLHRLSRRSYKVGGFSSREHGPDLVPVPRHPMRSGPMPATKRPRNVRCVPTTGVAGLPTCTLHRFGRTDIAGVFNTTSAIFRGWRLLNAC